MKKGKDDFVTTVDKALDSRLLQGFRQLFPEDGVITEENRETFTQFGQNKSHLWFVDPIDGTDDFIQGRADYAVMVGQCRQGIPVAGWVYAPAYRHLFWGGSGWGLFHQSEQHGQGSLPAIEPPYVPGRPWSMVIGYKDWQRFGPALRGCLPKFSVCVYGQLWAQGVDSHPGRSRIIWLLQWSGQTLGYHWTPGPGPGGGANLL